MIRKYQRAIARLGCPNPIWVGTRARFVEPLEPLAQVEPAPFEIRIAAGKRAQVVDQVGAGVFVAGGVGYFIKQRHGAFQRDFCQDDFLPVGGAHRVVFRERRIQVIDMFRGHGHLLYS